MIVELDDLNVRYKAKESDQWKTVGIDELILNYLDTRWIPVTERLPETSDSVLVTYIFHSDRLLAGAKIVRAVVTANCYNEDWFPHDGEFNFELVDVLAWMPLPEPYAK